MKHLGCSLMRRREQLHHILIDSRRLECATYELHNGAVAVDGVAAPFEHAGAPALEAEREHIKRHIRASFINHPYHPKRYRYLAYFQSVGKHRFHQHLV